MIFFCLNRVRAFEWDTSPEIPQDLVRFKQHIQFFCFRSIPNAFSDWSFGFILTMVPDFGRENSGFLKSSPTNDVFIAPIINKLDKITAFDLIWSWFTSCLGSKSRAPKMSKTIVLWQKICRILRPDSDYDILDSRLTFDYFRINY